MSAVQPDSGGGNAFWTPHEVHWPSEQMPTSPWGQGSGQTDPSTQADATGATGGWLNPKPWAREAREAREVKIRKRMFMLGQLKGRARWGAAAGLSSVVLLCWSNRSRRLHGPPSCLRGTSRDLTFTGRIQLCTRRKKKRIINDDC